jgi:ubiquinone/menaquinone biosynthesis C-methylase UbiE
MAAEQGDSRFDGSIPQFYEAHMVPMLFAPYAEDLVARLAARSPRRVLELAAGTGVVTRAMVANLPGEVAIVATDLNQAMLDYAAAVGTARPVTWCQADAMQLPFGEAEFDAVVCQFGVMFFPDQQRAFAEARRVLCEGGCLLFNVWDRIEESEIEHEVVCAVAALFPDDPPRFLERTPHGHHDVARLCAALRAAGFSAAPEVETLALTSVARSALSAARALCEGTPLRGEIEARGARAEDASRAAEQALIRRFGGGRIEGRMRAHVVSVQR